MVLVIGSVGYRGVASVAWDSPELPNIVDHDAVVVDVRSISDVTLAGISHERFSEVRRQLVRLLDSGGSVLVASDVYRIHSRDGDFPDRVGNYDWCPVGIRIADEQGDTVEICQQRFSAYLTKLNRWPYYFFVPTACLASEITDRYGPPRSTKYKVAESPIAKNRYGKPLAVSLRVEVRQPRISVGWEGSQHQSYPDHPDKALGEIVLLPLIEDLDHREAVRLVLCELLGEPIPEIPPTWAEDLEVPGVQCIEKKMAERQAEVEAAREALETLGQERAQLNSVRRLMFASGEDLEDVVRMCLEKLGVNVAPAQGNEEYVLEYGGQRCLAEVKGVSKSVSLGHLQQLVGHLFDHEQKTQERLKGVIIANAWRTTVPMERGTKDKPEFPDNVCERSRQLQIALVSTKDLFTQFCRYLEGGIEANKILEPIFQGAGPVTFPAGDR